MFAFLIKDGYSVSRAVEILAQQSAGDIGKMFAKASQLLKTGASTADAFASAGFPEGAMCHRFRRREIGLYGGSLGSLRRISRKSNHT